MENKLVSVVIPCYNVEKYLNDAVQSVLQQTYNNIEIILVDDGSTDSTPELCNDYAEKYQNIYTVHKENGGLSSARNTGLEVAKGIYVYFLDADDYIEDVMMEYLVEKMDEKELDAIFFGSYNVDETGKLLDMHTAKIEDDKIYAGWEAYGLFCSKKVYSSCVPFYIYRKSFLDFNALRFLDGVIYEDELFSFEVYHQSRRLMMEKRPFYYRRIRLDSIMRATDNIERKFESTMLIMDRIVNSSYLTDFTEEEYRNILLFLLRIHDHMNAKFSELPWEKRIDRAKEYRKYLKIYITLAFEKKQLLGVSTCIKRYVLSLYLNIKR